MSADRPTRVTPSGAGTRRSLIIAVAVSALALGLCAWLIVTDAPAYRFVVRLYEDKQLMHAMLARWGVLAPVVFIAIQALQVIIAPIPGEVTGLLGGFVFGPWLGFFYSTIGLTIGSLGAFWVGRRLGATFVQGLVAPQVWERMGFLVEAEGAILWTSCAISSASVRCRFGSSPWCPRSGACREPGPCRPRARRRPLGAKRLPQLARSLGAS
ncbi:MAG TPA: VTT domain-containing protein [Methylomirabilota bacterium]|nr:VTT domain-containing protein [Methylomirabilota bacterium]